MEFIRLVQSDGELLDGSTRLEFTNHFEVVPSHVLETGRWAGSDRMRGLGIGSSNLRNSQDVVEVRVTVLNQPYGSFPWIGVPMTASSNGYNAHNFYGDLTGLDAATLDEARRFARTYYAPGNAVLTVVGDYDPAQARARVAQYCGRRPERRPLGGGALQHHHGPRHVVGVGEAQVRPRHA